MSVTQYIGARYVPVFADPAEWSSENSYEPLTIVLHNGNSYTSAQYVPVGIDIENDSYWKLTGNFNSQVEQYRTEVKTFDGRITTADNTANNALSLAQTNEKDIATLDSEMAGTSDSGLKDLIDNNKNYADSKFTSIDAELAGTSDSGLKTLIDNNKNYADSKFTSIDAELAGTSDSGLKTLIDNLNVNQSFVNIATLGCIKEDNSVDNAAIINEYLTNNPGSALYVPAGNWYISTTVNLGTSNIICSGSFALSSLDNLTDNTMVKCGEVREHKTQLMIHDPFIVLKVDGRGFACNGASLGGYFLGHIYIFTYRCLNIGISAFSFVTTKDFHFLAYGVDDNNRGKLGWDCNIYFGDSTGKYYCRDYETGLKFSYNENLGDSDNMFLIDCHIWGCLTAIEDDNSYNKGIIFENFYNDSNEIGYLVKGSRADQYAKTILFNNVYMIANEYQGNANYFYRNELNYKTTIKIGNFRYSHVNNAPVQPSGSIVYASDVKNVSGSDWLFGRSFTIDHLFSDGPTNIISIQCDDILNLSEEELTKKYGPLALEQLYTGCSYYFEKLSDTSKIDELDAALTKLHLPIFPDDGNKLGQTQIAIRALPIDSVNIASGRINLVTKFPYGYLTYIIRGGQANYKNNFTTFTW